MKTTARTNRFFHALWGFAAWASIESLKALRNILGICGLFVVIFALFYYVPTALNWKRTEASAPAAVATKPRYAARKADAYKAAEEMIRISEPKDAVIEIVGRDSYVVMNQAWAVNIIYTMNGARRLGTFIVMKEGARIAQGQINNLPEPN